MDIYKKRGYVKWRDEDGKLHKVKEEEYETVHELVEEADDSMLPESEDSRFL